MAHKSCNSRAVQLVHYFPCSRLFSHRVQSYQLDSCDSLDIFDDGASYLSNGVYKQVLVRIDSSILPCTISCGRLNSFFAFSSLFFAGKKRGESCVCGCRERKPFARPLPYLGCLDIFEWLMSKIKKEEDGILFSCFSRLFLFFVFSQMMLPFLWRLFAHRMAPF